MIDTNGKKKKIKKKIKQPLVSKKGTGARLGASNDSINPIPSLWLHLCWRLQLLKGADGSEPQAELQVLRCTCPAREEEKRL